MENTNLPEEEPIPTEEPEEPLEAPSAERTPSDLSGYGRRAYELLRKRFGPKKPDAAKEAGKAAEKAATTAASKAAGSAAGAAVGSAVPVVGTAVGAVVGAITSKLVEKFGPRGIKILFYILLALFILSLTFALTMWGLVGGARLGKKGGPSPAVEEDVFALNGDLKYAAKRLEKNLSNTANMLKAAQSHLNEGDGRWNQINSFLKRINDLEASSQNLQGGQRQKELEKLAQELRDFAIANPELFSSSPTETRAPRALAYQGGEGDVRGVLAIEPGEISQLCVSKAKRKMYFYEKEENKMVGWIPINIGIGSGQGSFDGEDKNKTGSHVTPVGEFHTLKARRCSPYCTSQGEKNLGPVVIPIKELEGRGIVIHGGPLGKNNALRPTYGCIRAYDEHLEQLADYMSNKDIIIKGLNGQCPNEQ